MEEKIDPRSKPNCIICFDDIDQRKYLVMGNFCQKCNSSCGDLSRIWPGDMPWPDNTEQLKNWEERKEMYAQIEKRFRESFMI